MPVMSTVNVTREQLIRLILDLPQSQLQAVYDYIIDLEEEADDIAAVEDAVNQPKRQFKEFVEELKRDHLYP